MQTILEVSAAVIGCMAAAVVLLLFVRSRRRRRSPAKENSPEWTPVRCLKYQSTNSSGLANQVTRVITQTTGKSKSHSYPVSSPDPWGANRQKTDRSVLAKKQYNPLNRDAFDAVGAADRIKNTLSPELESVDGAGSLSSVFLSDDDSSPDLEINQRSALSGSKNDKMNLEVADEVGKPPEFLAEEWSMPSRHPTIEFSVMYMSSSSTLVVHVSRLINLFLKNRSSTATVVKIKLKNQLTSSKPQAATPPHRSGSATCKKTFDEENGACLTFSVQSCSDLRNCFLLIFLYQTKFRKLREKLLGEVLYSLAQLELTSGVPVKCIEKLILNNTKKHADSSKEKLLHEDHGQLMLSLFYQVDANRMKVLVRKAANLPKRKKVLTQPEFYVIVNAFCGGKNMASQETKSIRGHSPIWNHPLIFDLPSRDLEKYSIQFIVMNGQVTDRKGVVGHIVIGPDVRGTGQSHWKEAICPRSTETARWHKLQLL